MCAQLIEARYVFRLEPNVGTMAHYVEQAMYYWRRDAITDKVLSKVLSETAEWLADRG